MIFPEKLPYVTLYLPDTGTYYELTVSGAQARFAVEPFYNRQAISAKNDLKFAGYRTEMEFTFDQTRSHDVILDFFNDLYTEAPDYALLYLRDEASITPYTTGIEVTLQDFLSRANYRNTINRHGYTMSFTGRSRDFGIGLAYLVDYSEVPYLNYDNERYLVRLNPY
jgi:hypothetical protein